MLLAFFLNFILKKKSVTTAGLIRKKLGTAQLTYYLCMMCLFPVLVSIEGTTSTFWQQFEGKS
jgi:hypothetical protein